MAATDALPKRVVVSRVLSGRYKPGSRPVSWDKRKDGIESVVTSTGETIRLLSNGGQSTPSENWELFLTDENLDSEGTSYSWTLYGIKPTI